MNVPVNTVGAIIWKWKKHHFTINRSWPVLLAGFRKNSSIIRRVIKAPRMTSGVLQKDLELATTISNALTRHGLYAHSPCKTPLLKKKHVEAHLKFAAQQACEILGEYSLVR